MIGLEQIDPTNFDHLDRYLGLLAVSRIDEVAQHLPDIFEEENVYGIQAGIRGTGALRYFVVVDGLTVGRAELTRHLNDDPSIISRTPEGVTLGFNTCYFINPAQITRNLEKAHQVVADKSIREAFIVGDAAEERAPWLPVSMDGTDVSRGWLMQEGNPGYAVHGDEPRAGIFPQFGIGNNEYSIQHAELNK